MDKISFDAGLTKYNIKSIQPTAKNVLCIVYADEKPDESVYGLDISLYTGDNILETVLTGWTTVYKIDGDAVYLSNDGSIYTEPEETEPGPQYEPEPYEPTVEELQTYKISQMESTCASTIKSGVDVNDEHFSLSTDTRLALIVRQHEIDSGEDEIDFYPDGEASRYYSAEEMQAIIDAANELVNYNEVYCNELCLWIETLTDKDEIEAVYYGMDIPETHRSEVLEKMLPVADDETGMIPQDGDDEPEDDDEPDNDDKGSILGEDDIAPNDPADEPEAPDDGED